MLLVALASPPAFAEDKGLGAQVDDALADALKRLEFFIERFPGYEAPEVAPNGDIIIRKKQPRPATGEPDADGRVKI